MSKQKPKKKGSKSKARPVQAKKNDQLFWYLGALLAATLIVYIPSLQNGFTNWDDPTYVTENSFVLQGNWSALWTEVVSLNYHPLTIDFPGD